MSVIRGRSASHYRDQNTAQTISNILTFPCSSRVKSLAWDGFSWGSGTRILIEDIWTGIERITVCKGNCEFASQFSWSVSQGKYEKNSCHVLSKQETVQISYTSIPAQVLDLSLVSARPNYEEWEGRGDAGNKNLTHTACAAVTTDQGSPETP